MRCKGSGLLRSTLIVVAWLAAPAHADALQDGLQARIWGNEKFDDQHCADNPHTIQFLDGGQRMVFVWRKPILYHTGAEMQRIGAAIIARLPDRLVVVQDGEDRIGADGNPAQFDLFLRPDGGYCFIMTDAHAQDCLRPNLPCAGLEPVS